MDCFYCAGIRPSKTGRVAADKWRLMRCRCLYGLSASTIHFSKYAQRLPTFAAGRDDGTMMRQVSWASGAHAPVMYAMLSVDSLGICAIAADLVHEPGRSSTFVESLTRLVQS